MMTETTWADATATAKERKAIGATDIHLFKAGLDDLDWSACTGIQVGGGHRMELDTTVVFLFADEGLTGRWYFELERREANGMGQYIIDTEAVLAVLARVKGGPRRDFLRYLANGADAVEKRGGELLAAAEKQFGMAGVMARLAADTQPNEVNK